MNGQKETTIIGAPMRMKEEVESMTMWDLDKLATYECFECDTEWSMVPEHEEDINGNSGREVEFCPYCGSQLHEPALQLDDDLDFDGDTDYDQED